MPLRIVKRRGRAILYVRGTVRGQSVFESTGTDRRELADAYRAKREQELFEASVYGQRAVVTFSTAVASYLSAETRRRGQVALVARLQTLLGRRRLTEIGQADLDRAYLALLRPGASPATKLRNVLTPLRAILEHAARRGWCDRPAFEVPRQPPARVPRLTPIEATALVEQAADHLRPLIIFLIGSAARMSEALELDWTDVDLTARTVRFRRTKTGRERVVELPPVAVIALAALAHRQGRVFRPVYSVRRRRGEAGQQWRIGEAYRDNDRVGGGQIKRGWASACRRADLPGRWREWGDPRGKPQREFVPDLHPHDLRHVAASWHWLMHRDLMRLRDFGGWGSSDQVDQYTHVLPEHITSDVAAWLGLASRGRRTEVA